MYYFFNPFSRQYYFPEGFKKFKLFKTFYQPYTLKGRVLWFLWLRFSFLRMFCKAKNPNEILPVNNLKKIVGNQVLLAFNRGTEGVEQKTTVLGINTKTKDEFFIKYAETIIARSNVNIEGNVLKQLKHLDFVPKLFDHKDQKNFTIIRTSILEGHRYTEDIVDLRLINILKILSEQKIDVKNKSSERLETTFAHGDFCPWNIIENQNKLFVFDWELAGNYPCGYDLFTYIFQTAALLKPNKDIKEIHNCYKEEIKLLFKFFNISDYKPYLLEFAKIKYNIETKKNNNILIPYYKKLEEYAKNL